MADQLPPPPSAPPADGGALPPPPTDVPRPSVARLVLAIVTALVAVGGIAAILVASLGEPARVDTASSGSGGAVLFRDDFSGPSAASRWLEADDDSGSMGYRDGTYRIAVKDQGELQSLAALGSKEPSVRVEVDGTMVEGDGGFSILCVAEVSGSPGRITTQQDRGVYYDFFLSYADHGFAILSSEDLSTPLIVAEDRAGVLRLGGPTHVEVGCVGASGGRPAELTFRVNGQEVLRFSDPDGAESFAGVGLTVYSKAGAAAAEFDDVTVSRP